ILFDKNRPKSMPLSSNAGRFFDPVASTSSVFGNPGPGLYDVAHMGTTFGNATIGVAERNVGMSWGNDHRCTDTNAPNSQSVATLKLNPHGYAYFSDLNATSGNNYHPNMMSRSSRDAKRWEIGRRNPCKGQALLDKPGEARKRASRKKNGGLTIRRVDGGAGAGAGAGAGEVPGGGGAAVPEAA
ncbi:hypothetical protein TeGR_g8381, partial [Tetraparma gracilis]